MDSAAYGGGKQNKKGKKKRNSQGNEDSECVLSFEIGQRESCFYSERTDRITNRITDSTVLVYRCHFVNLSFQTSFEHYQTGLINVHI